MFSCEFCEISKKTFFYRTPLVAASAKRGAKGEIELEINYFRKKAPLQMFDVFLNTPLDFH